MDLSRRMGHFLDHDDLPVTLTLGGSKNEVSPFQIHKRLWQLEMFF